MVQRPDDDADPRDEASAGEPSTGHAAADEPVAGAAPGDGTPQGTTVAFVDPSPAASGTPETFAEFARRLDATDVVSLGLGLMHF